MKKYSFILLALIIVLSVSCIKSKNNAEKINLNNNEKNLLDFYSKNKYEFEKNEEKIDSLRIFLLSEKGKSFLKELDEMQQNETNPAQRLNIQSYRNSFTIFLTLYKSIKSHINDKNEIKKHYQNTPNDFTEFLMNNYGNKDYTNSYEIVFKEGIIILTSKDIKFLKSFRYNGNTFIEL